MQRERVFCAKHSVSAFSEALQLPQPKELYILPYGTWSGGPPGWRK